MHTQDFFPTRNGTNRTESSRVKSLLAAFVCADDSGANCDECRTRLILFSFLFTVLGLIFKGFIGVVCGSRALVADAVHSLTDALCFGLNYKSSRSGNVGSGVSSMDHNPLIGAAILLSGVWVCAHNTAILICGSLAHPGLWSLFVAAFSLVANWRVFKISKCVASRYSDPHVFVCVVQNRTNSFAACLSFFGVLLAEFGLLYFDPICAVIIGGLLVASGFEILFTSMPAARKRSSAMRLVGLASLAILAFYGFTVRTTFSTSGVLLVPSSGMTVGDPVDELLGRARYFIVLNTQTHTYAVVPNHGRYLPGDVSNFLVSVVTANNVDVVLACKVGTEIFTDLQAKGVRIYYFRYPGSVQQIVDEFQRGSLKLARASNVTKGYGRGEINWIKPW